MAPNEALQLTAQSAAALRVERTSITRCSPNSSLQPTVTPLRGSPRVSGSVRHQRQHQDGASKALIPSTIPLVVRQLSGNNAPELVWENELGGVTFRAGNRFVKWNLHTTGIDLESERLRLRWAIRWHPVPRVLDWGANDEAQWMVTAALPGKSAIAESWLARPLDAARAIGRGLRMLHDALPVTDCPFDWSVETRTGHRVPVTHLGMPPIDRLVVCHGDACSPNTIIAPDGSPAGHVDLGSLGVADRWADLAVASMNLDYNYGPHWEDEFFTAYGIERDEERIAFYRFLWENEDKIGVPSYTV